MKYNEDNRCWNKEMNFVESLLVNKHDTGRWLVLVRSQKYTRSKVVPLKMRGRRRCEDLGRGDNVCQCIHELE